MNNAIPYGRQYIDQDDISAVIEALKSDYLTTGPRVAAFEERFAAFVGARYAVAVANGTAALHIAALAADLKQGDEVITTPMTFAASANCVLYAGAKPVFADISPHTGLIDPSRIEAAITERTKAIIPVDYAGQPVDLAAIRKIADEHSLLVIEDACHALGARYRNGKIGDGKYADMTIFSLHPVKHITTGEGGVITTNDETIFQRLKLLRTHGITKDPSDMHDRDEGGWYYEMQALGFNYRITDFQCALGISQLDKLDWFLQERRAIASRYRIAFREVAGIELLTDSSEVENAYHLFVIKLADSRTRRALYDHLIQAGIYCQVHYSPVYRHPYYESLGYEKGLCAQAERFYEQILSIPIYVGLIEEEQDTVIESVKSFLKAHR